jgi:GNAT superfamily N-acetyltransferase
VTDLPPTNEPSPHESARTASLDELHDIAALAQLAIDEKRTQRGGELWARRERRPDPLDESLRASLRAPDQEVAVGLLDGTVVGYGAVRIELLADGGQLGIIEDLFVDPGARAVGVGEALMNHLVDWCRERGCIGVDSLALPGDRHTKNFFESFGLVARAIVVHRRFDGAGAGADDSAG